MSAFLRSVCLVVSSLRCASSLRCVFLSRRQGGLHVPFFLSRLSCFFVPGCQHVSRWLCKLSLSLPPSVTHREPRYPLKLDELQHRRGAGHQVFRRQLQALRRSHVVRIAEAHALTVQVKLHRQRRRVLTRAHNVIDGQPDTEKTEKAEIGMGAGGGVGLVS